MAFQKKVYNKTKRHFNKARIEKKPKPKGPPNVLYLRGGGNLTHYEKTSGITSQSESQPKAK